MGLKRKEIHNRLRGRDASESHPLLAITGLDTRLNLIEGVNDTQQEDINSLLVSRPLDGGSFTDTGTIEYDGGGF